MLCWLRLKALDKMMQNLCGILLFALSYGAFDGSEMVGT
jgi:hypothetical protein